MINIIETAYPKIRSYITKDELYRIYTPSDEELILAQENTKGDLCIKDSDVYSDYRGDDEIRVKTGSIFS